MACEGAFVVPTTLVISANFLSNLSVLRFSVGGLYFSSMSVILKNVIPEFFFFSLNQACIINDFSIYMQLVQMIVSSHCLSLYAYHPLWKNCSFYSQLPDDHKSVSCLKLSKDVMKGNLTVLLSAALFSNFSCLINLQHKNSVFICVTV